MVLPSKTLSKILNLANFSAFCHSISIAASSTNDRRQFTTLSVQHYVHNAQHAVCLQLRLNYGTDTLYVTEPTV